MTEGPKQRIKKRKEKAKQLSPVQRSREVEGKKTTAITRRRRKKNKLTSMNSEEKNSAVERK